MRIPFSSLLSKSISTRFLVLTVTMVFVIFGSLGVFIATQNAAALRSALGSKANSVANLASSTGGEYLTNFNFIALDLLVDNIAKDPEVVFAGFYDIENQLVTKRPLPVALGDVETVTRELKGADGAVVGSLKIVYRQDAISRSLMKSIFILVAGTLAAIVLLAGGISVISKRLILGPVNRLCASIAIISEGDLSHQLQSGADDEIGALADSLNVMVSSLNQMVRQVNSATSELAGISDNLADASEKVVTAARLQAEAITNTSSAVVQINASIKGVAQNVETLSVSASESASSILEMAASVEEVALNTENLSQASGNVSSSIVQMASSIKQVGNGVNSLLEATNSTASSVMEMDVSIKQVEKNAADASAISAEVRKDAELGKIAVEASISGIIEIKKSSDLTIEVMNSLSSRANDIGAILSVIDNVASQTNLLALNASIIAAQAGEQGRSFAVVAEEIKALAERTRTSTREITEVIKGVQNETELAVNAIQTANNSIVEGKTLAERSGEALEKIYSGVQKTTEQMQEIARATLEQSKGSQLIRDATERVSAMVTQIANATREQALGSSQIISATDEMKQLTDQVRNATREQSNVGNFIAASTENISGMISQVKRASEEQSRGSEQISLAVGDIQSSAQINLEATRMMNDSVTNIFTQINVLKKEMSSFKV